MDSDYMSESDVVSIKSYAEFGSIALTRKFFNMAMYVEQFQK